MDDSNDVFAGFIIGAVVGVALGVLLAPEKGSETRRKLKEEGLKMADSFQEKVHEVMDHVDTWKEKVMSKVKDAGGTV